MKRGMVFVCAVVLSLQVSLPAQGSEHEMEADSAGVETESGEVYEVLREEQHEPLYAAHDKDTGILLSIFPGIAIHGFGNFYAGRVGTGLLLLGTEAIGISMLIASFSASMKDFHPFDRDREHDETEETWLALGGIGLFLFSWIYDIATVGGAIDDYNARHSGISLSIEEDRLLLTYKF